MSADMQAIYVLHPITPNSAYQSQYVNHNSNYNRDYDNLVRENEHLSYNYKLLKRQTAAILYAVIIVIYILMMSYSATFYRSVENVGSCFSKMLPRYTNGQSTITLNLADLTDEYSKLANTICTPLAPTTHSAIESASSDTESVTSEDTIKYAKSIKPTAATETASQKSAPAAITASVAPESTK